MRPVDVLAHGIGGSTDLPIPFEYALLGASWALTVSFVVLGLAWKTPRFQSAAVEAPAPRWRPAVAALGLVLAAGWVYALAAGPADANPGVGVLYVLVWVGLVPLALTFGHVWRDLSPLRTVHRLLYVALRRRPDDGFRRYPGWLGYWPAAAGLFSFVWLELVSPDAASVAAVAGWLGAYAVVTLAGALVFGARWFDRGDPFDVYSGLVATLSPFFEGDRATLHNPLRTLPTIRIDRGLTAVVAVLLGSTAFDSFSASASWQARGTGVLADTLAMSALIAVVGTSFWCAARATGGVTPAERSALPGLLVHSLVPIVVGYVVAHYVSYLVEKGQQTVIDLFGLSIDPVYWLSEHPGFLAALKVLAVVTGHVVAVVAAHDRALAVLPRAHRLTGQLAMLLLMVAFTVGGLFLLFDV